MGSVKALSFDLWDTLVFDDSDEPKRKALGLRPKPVERWHLLWEALHRQQPTRPEDIKLAFEVMDAAFRRVWRQQHVTWTLRERFETLLGGLGRSLPASELDRLLAAEGAMEADIPPEPIPGAGEALAALHCHYRQAVISDTVFTPAWALRRILDGHNLSRHFDATVFSDEVGHSKPHRRCFEVAAERLGVQPSELVHIGDRQHNDITGAQAVGAKAVLFVAARAVDRPSTTADAVCESFADLPKVIATLAGARA